jgi:hypothetical protein
LQAERDRDGKVVDEGAKCGTFLVHVDEYLADPAVVIFAGAEIHFMSADHGLLGVALAAIRHFFALAHHDDALDQPLHDFLRKLCGARRHRLVIKRLDRILFLVVVADQLRVQRLRQL